MTPFAPTPMQVTNLLVWRRNQSRRKLGKLVGYFCVEMEKGEQLCVEGYV